MNKILYTATNHQGKCVANYISTKSLKIARKELEDQGLINITFHSDPFIASNREDLADLNDKQLIENAKFEAKCHKKSSLKTNLTEVLKRGLWFYVILTLVFITALYQGRTLTTFFVVILASIPLLITAFRYKKVSVFNQMLQAHTIGDWDAVQKHSIDVYKNTPIKEVKCEADIYLAKAYTAKGEIELGLKTVQKWEQEMNQISYGLYQSRLSTLYYQIQDYDKYIALQKESFELSQSDMAALDLAMAEVRVGSKVTAKELIAHVDSDNLTTMAQIYKTWISGLIIFLDEPEKSIQFLKQALDGLQQLPDNPSILLMTALCSTDYAIQLQYLGETELAKNIIRKHQQIIKIHADKTTVMACNNILATD